MHLLEQNDKVITLRITPSEALIINNALNESLEAFDGDDEFETRMGVKQAEVADLLEAFSQLWHSEG